MKKHKFKTRCPECGEPPVTLYTKYSIRETFFTKEPGVFSNNDMHTIENIKPAKAVCSCGTEWELIDSIFLESLCEVEP